MEKYILSSKMLTKEDYFINICVVILFMIIMLICRIFWNAKDVPDIELLYDDSFGFMSKIIPRCQSLNEKYIPTYLWGKSGHCQSLLHTIFGRFGYLPDLNGKRYQITAPDGSNLSYDIFEPDNNGLNEMVLIVPGICNHAESKYIKAFSHNMIAHGFRVVVFNHTGALKTVELKRPKIFTYGQTADLDAVVKHLLATEKVKKFIGLGFSMGGNVLMKYLGENVERQKYFHFAVSVCQGYDIPEAYITIKEGDNLRWIYNYGLTRNVLKIVNHHKETLANYCQLEQPPICLNWEEIFASRALHQLDESFTLKIYKENDINAFYKDNSSSQYMNKISIPMLIINVQDDPIVPEKLFKYPRNLIDINKNTLFVVTRYGGHLGFFEGGFLIPNRISWMDRMLAEFFQVAVAVINEDSENEENNNMSISHVI